MERIAVYYNGKQIEKIKPKHGTRRTSCPVFSFCTISIQSVDNKARTQFKLKPSGLGRHDVARVGKVYGKNGQ
jgi:hypothetical protein